MQSNGHITLEPLGSVVDRAAAIGAKYLRPGPSPTLSQLREAFERGVAEEVIQSMVRETSAPHEEP